MQEQTSEQSKDKNKTEQAPAVFLPVIPFDRPAVVLLSGGQDSTTCLYWAKKWFSRVIAVSFRYGQKHVREVEQAMMIAAKAQVAHQTLDVPKTVFPTSSLLNHAMSHNDTSAWNDGLPASFTPGRNIIFLTLAALFGYQHNAFDLVTGVCETDYSGYPDCRQDFLDALEQTLNLGLAREVQIHAPLMYRTKAATWAMAKELGCLDVIVDYTLTDYNGDMSVKHPWGYGNENNPATKLRAAGYFEAKEKGWI